MFTNIHRRQFRGNNTGGVGLGLTICKQLVEAMGGQIDYTSVENEGTTFFFTIPVTVVSSSMEKTNNEINESCSMQHVSEDVLTNQVPNYDTKMMIST